MRSTSCGSPTSPSTRRLRFQRSLQHSKIGVVALSPKIGRSHRLVHRLGARLRRRHSTNIYTHFNKQMLLPPIEPSQFTSWAFTDKVRQAGLMPSFGSVGDAFDNAMMESFWSSMQIELLDRKRWKTRVELSNAIFEYIELFYNRRRRHSSLGYVSPIEFERSLIHQQTA